MNQLSAPTQQFTDRLVREAERAKITSVSRTSAWALEKKGKFPKRRRLHADSDRVCWLLSELLEFVQSREVIDMEQAS
ncbi:helix-turn-helix transcriptional regulator [Pseudoalteromonas ruthenica]|uniref:Transcriptional regulator n=1 Tax=Pseudoalteromonas ruthenica TaxID=151081 RepID=A0A0F4PQA5_9GAMM|nr:AlpA family phage regulatory protein [Pseudoalteromonas ruthenica]KJY93931.1 transcriptional regulator [Pseudoalteromonas ruthenica]KJY96421.1 transcriptional regulator [Pseudoalteromonas ruthenica]TMO94591.1 AlpA family phage regulatory protein [Pseudoalteromonas ruthenica]TMO97250.1 AlpA family phage regulatory protein [Pseudoalteromonas ruthenica]TMP09204.1 AlpA family phage regulatory protein [Pseudoalteromonas ruthenica]